MHPYSPILHRLLKAHIAREVTAQQTPQQHAILNVYFEVTKNNMVMLQYDQVNLYRYIYTNI